MFARLFVRLFCLLPVACLACSEGHDDGLANTSSAVPTATSAVPGATTTGSGNDTPAASAPTAAPGIALASSSVPLASVARAGTYPRLLKLANGQLLATVTHVEGRQFTLMVSSSADGGATFADGGSIASDSNAQPDNAHLLELPLRTGETTPVLLAAFRNHEVNSSGTITHFRLTVCTSTDGGKTWKFLSQALESDPPVGLWEPFLRLRKNGWVELTYSQENTSGGQALMQLISKDRGATWAAPQAAVSSGTRVRDGMPGIAATRDRSTGADALVMVFETNGSGLFSVESVVSYDDGATWGQRATVHVAPSQRNAGAPQVASFADGSLVATFMTDEDLAATDWANAASVKVSYAPGLKAGAMAWQAPTVLGAANSYWPGILRVSDGRLLGCFDNGGGKARAIDRIGGALP